MSPAVAVSGTAQVASNAIRSQTLIWSVGSVMVNEVIPATSAARAVAGVAMTAARAARQIASRAPTNVVRRVPRAPDLIAC